MKLKLRTGVLAVLGIMLIFSVPLVAQDQGDEDYTFRSTRWGMSKSEVIEKEGEPDYQSEASATSGFEEGILYAGLSVGDLDARLVYFFTENKLVRGGYFFKESHSNRHQYIVDFETIKELLTNLYGRPEKDQETRQGYLRTTWETEKTKIWMVLDEDNYEVRHRLFYDSKEFKKLVEQKEKEQAQSQF